MNLREENGPQKKTCWQKAVKARGGKEVETSLGARDEG
jgi:hypothetical protein